MLLRFINEISNFFIANLIGKGIIHKGLFYIFKFIKEDRSRGRLYFSYGNMFLWLFFYNERGIHYGNWGCMV